MSKPTYDNTFFEPIAEIPPEIIDKINARSKSIRERDDHRKEFDDIQWADQQPTGAPNFNIGDIVEFKVGGYGMISEIRHTHGGWPSKYATAKIETLPPPPYYAWHYEGDFTLKQAVTIPDISQ